MTTRRMSKELSGKLIVSFGSLLIGIGATKLPNVSAWFSLLAGIGVFAWGFFVEKKVSGNPSQVRTEKPSSQPAQQREILVMCISTGNSISPVPLGDDLGEDLCKLAEQKRDCHVKGENLLFGVGNSRFAASSTIWPTMAH